jgi:hypothetical protein
MTRKSRDNTGPTRYNGDKPARSRPPTYGTSRTTRTTRTGTTRIAGTETVTMTADQYENAIEALAVLITRWHHSQHDDDPDRDGQPVAA